MIVAPFWVREVGEGEVGVVRELALEIWPACYAGIISGEQIAYMLGWMYSEERLLADVWEGVRYEVLVAGEKTAREVGFAGWGGTEERGMAKLHKLYVLPGYQGRGLGSGLLQHVMGRAREAGFERMRLNVNKRNEGAIRCYGRNGFAVVESVYVAIGGGFVMDDYVMERGL